MVLSIHTQDHISVRDVGRGPVRTYETIGTQAKSCSHLPKCWITAQDHVVGLEATRDMGTAATGATCRAVRSFRCKRAQAFSRAILWELWQWEQGSRGAQWMRWVEG